MHHVAAMKRYYFTPLLHHAAYASPCYIMPPLHHDGYFILSTSYWPLHVIVA